MSEADNPKKMVEDLLNTYTTDQGINYEELMHLLLRWGSLTLYIVSPLKEEQIPPKKIEVENGWTIHDYGNKLVISRGEEWPLGYLNNGKLLNSIKRMVDLLLREGVDTVHASGFPYATRAAWMMLSEYGIQVPNFSPTLEDFKVRDNIHRVMKGEVKPAPVFRPGGG